MFLSGKGETTVHTYEVAEDSPHLFPLSPYKSSGGSQVSSHWLWRGHVTSVLTSHWLAGLQLPQEQDRAQRARY